MHDFKYVTRKERAPVKNDLIAIIKRTQNLLRDDLNFRFDFVGSDRRNMVTYVPQTIIGYDFDVNLEVNDDDCNYTPEKSNSKLYRR